MDNKNCAYCQKGELLDSFGYFALELKNSNVYIFKEQSHYGRLIIAHKKHVSEIVELTKTEREEFIEEINLISKAMHIAFKPQKINYGAYGDTGHHLHFHLVPKYKDDFEWGGVFQMNPGIKKVNNDECEIIAQKLRNALLELDR